MTGPVPPRARELARGLKGGFEADQKLATALNEAQDRLIAANTELWSGLHPDAIALLYDNTQTSGEDGRLKSKVTMEMELQRRADADPETVETGVLVVVQKIHWAIHRAFVNYQLLAEDPRHLAIDLGEQLREFVDVLTAAGWSEDAARNTNVETLADGRVDV